MLALTVLLTGCSSGKFPGKILNYTVADDSTEALNKTKPVEPIVTSKTTPGLPAYSSASTVSTTELIYPTEDTALPEIFVDPEPNINDKAPLRIGDLGSAGYIEGKTVIVSIFADDKNTSWNETDNTDVTLMYENLEWLKIAADWVTEQCGEYGVSSEFVCDWEENTDLYYRAFFGNRLVRFDSDMYYVQRAYILNEVKSAALKKKYEAENIIYIFYFNTDYSNDINPWSLTAHTDSMFDIEYINSFVRFKEFDIPPASYAHEILHCFGAHDLYYSSSAIPQEYVDHCTFTDSNDIMYTVNSGEEITVELSELDAYYVGLADNCPLVDEWGLAKRQW